MKGRCLPTPAHRSVGGTSRVFEGVLCMSFVYEVMFGNCTMPFDFNLGKVMVCLSLYVFYC